jgi:hypothetical protein
MVTLGTALGLTVIVAVHTVIAAVATRFFRLRMKTQWGSLLYALLAIPVLLVISTFVVSGVLQIGGDVGSTGAALFLVVLVPMTLGFALDFLWMPHPDDVELPDTQRS